MNTPVKYLVVPVCALALLGAQAAQARTPTPSPTPTPSATSTPPLSPTPPAQQVSVFEGPVWLDAQEYHGPLTAQVGGAVCGEGEPVAVADGRPNLYRVRVLSAQTRAGCGTEGAMVTFLLGDAPADQTGVWRAASTQSLTLIAGHPFARFAGLLSVNTNLRNEVLMPYVGDIPCGPSPAIHPPTWIGPGPMHGYESIVYSNEQQAGCGVEGADVTFKLVDTHGNVIPVAQEKGIWHAWDGLFDDPPLNLTMIPVGGITAGNVGTGPGIATHQAPWFGLALASLGLGAVAAGAVLRRRVAQ